MNDHEVQGGRDVFEHHSSVALPLPIESRTNFPNGLSSPFTSSALILFRRARAAES
jgi:hypothetical protein